MPAFKSSEIVYLSGQRLGSIATAQPDGTLRTSSVGFRYNEAVDTIGISG